MNKIKALIAMTVGFFIHIELMIIILMGIILLDTIVKMFSIRKTAITQGRKFRDVFKSRSLREGYIWKSLGYLIMAIAIFPLDYFILTPFVEMALQHGGIDLSIPTKAIFTNLLLVIFSLMEISSINENWYDITGENLLAKVSQMVKKIRSGIEEAYKFVRSTKTD